MHRWFHANLSVQDAEKLLLDCGVEGGFLVRPSKSCAGLFSLSVRRKDRVTHIRIRKVGDFYDLHGGEKFPTLTELVHYYTKNQLCEKNGEVFQLTKPVNSKDPTTERWFHGSISGHDAEKMIREKGVNGSFLVRKSEHQLGDFVLTVRYKDESSQAVEVTHVKIRHKDGKFDVGGGEKFDSLTELVEYYKRKTIVDQNGTVANLTHPFNATKITALNIKDRVKELSKENQQNDHKEGFWEEFEQLQHQECKILFNRKIGQKESNISKNRYKNILPYDYTRVILKRPRNNFIGDNKSCNGNKSSNKFSSTINKNDNVSVSENDDSFDYINANYIKLVDDETAISPRTKPVPHSKVYIATQGPLKNTVDDFWLMVWQENAECIVMVTQETERGKTKCYRYWPTLEEEKIICGHIEVKIISDIKLKSKEEGEYHVMRAFELRNLANDGTMDGNPIRRVLQHQHLFWPDQSIPTDPSSILDFLKHINQCSPRKGLWVVHCSAGIGRSGTLIVIDMLIDQLKHYGLDYEIDIQRIVKVVRAQRSGSVQTAAQYKFIYQAIQSYIQCVS